MRRSRSRGGSEAMPKRLGVEHLGGGLRGGAARVGDLGQRRAPVLGVGHPAHEPVGLELVDDVGHRRAVDLEALADLAQRQRARAREGEEHQRLVAREGQPVRAQQVVQARHQDLLGAHERRHRRHRRDGSASQRASQWRRASAIGSMRSGGLTMATAYGPSTSTPRHEPRCRPTDLRAAAPQGPSHAATCCSGVRCPGPADHRARASGRRRGTARREPRRGGDRERRLVVAGPPGGRRRCPGSRRPG